MTIYFAAGGLLGSAWVNSLQLVVMLAGFLLALPVVLGNAGGVSGVMQAPDAPPFFDTFFHSSGPGSGWMFLVLTAPSFLISPGLIQKAYSARSERALKLGIGLNAAVLMLFSFIPVIFGMAARTAVPGIASPNDVLPAFLMAALPAWLGALALSAVFSTEVDTCDTILFMLSTAISNDVYKRHFNPHASDAQLLRVARIAAAAGGASGVVLSLVVGTVLGAVTIFYQVMVVTFFVPIVGGLYVRGMHARAAVASIVAGLAGLLAAHLVDHSGVPLGGSGPGWRFCGGRGGRCVHVRRGRAAVPAGELMAARNIFDLTGKVAAVIGGGSGIGEAVAIGAAEAGATVACLDVNAEAAAAVAEKARAAGGRCDPGALDIRDADAVARTFDDIQNLYGSFDIVICTPSINVRKRIVDYADQELDRVLELNLKGNFNVVRAAGRIMTAERRGSIVLFSSIRSLSVEPGQSVYAVTKAGIVQLARGAACEFGPFGVRVNAVGPGVIDTPLTSPIRNNPAWFNAYCAKSVFNRWGTAEEMVGPTLFLASDAASFVTGTILYADGGWLAQDGRFTPPGM